MTSKLNNLSIASLKIEELAKPVSIDWLIDYFTAHQHRKAINAKKRC